MPFKITEERDGETTVIASSEPSLDVAIETCLDAAEQNGYIPGVESRSELESRLRTDMGYSDGEVTIEIRWFRAR